MANPLRALTRTQALTAAGERLSPPPAPQIAPSPQTTAHDYQLNAIKALQGAQSSSGWQDAAWSAYHQVGEIHFAANMIANLLSRIRIFPAAHTDANRPPTEVHDVPNLTPGIATAAAMAMERIASSLPLPALQKSLGLSMFVVGECYLASIPNPSLETKEEWLVLSTKEFRMTADGKRLITALTSINTVPNTPLPPNSYVARIFSPSPSNRFAADSSLRAILPLVEDLLLAQASQRAATLSRLPAGLLLLPDALEASAPPPPAPVATPTNNPDDPSQVQVHTPPPAPSLEEVLIEGMLTPVQDPSSAGSLVPLILRGPEEALPNVRLLNFERPQDHTIQPRADRLLERILQGLDLPKEVVSGLSSLKYSNSTNLETALLKTHVEPLAELICHSLTTAYLRPALQASGFTYEQAARIQLWYDPSPIVNHPNRSQDAANVYDRFGLSARSLREANGFSETDAPSDAELILRILLLKGSITPEVAESLMRNISPLTFEAARAAQAESTGNALPDEVQEALGFSTGDEASPPTETSGTPGPTPGPPRDVTNAPTPSGPNPNNPAQVQGQPGTPMTEPGF